MDYRQLGASGLRVSALTLGTMTFGGRDNFASVGSTDVDGARRQLDLCLDHGVNFVDTANVYSGGLSEEILGKAIEGRRDRLLLATKARMPMGDGAERRRPLPPPPDRRVRGEPAAPRDRPHRPLPGARVGRADAARGDDGGARLARAQRQGALRRGVQLLRLAADEGARPSPTVTATSASSPSRSTTRCRPATPSTSSSRSPSTRASASSSGARSPAACCPASTGATRRARRDHAS